jgi:choline dehydrogenase-like flavoprotein
MIYIIGSGPAGISAAVALIEKGYQVTMLDAGYELENERVEVVKRLYISTKEKWDAKDIAIIKENSDPHSEGVNIKYLYGSDYPYKGMDTIQPIQFNQSKMVRSLAKGGLSNVWGASILPYIKEDISDWPISYDKLEFHYKEVLKFMPMAAKEDDLSSHFPLSPSAQSFSVSNQVSRFYSDIKHNKKVLNNEGFNFGNARLAVNFEADANEKKCIYCGLCLYGCPYDLIYSTVHTLSDLNKMGNFKYIPNVLVNGISEIKGLVRIHAKSLIENKELEFQGDKVLIAAGTVSSTRILLNSLGALNKPVFFKHSDHFQIPLLRYQKSKDFNKEDIFTLSQMFIELNDKSISNNLIHMQLYGYSDLFDKVMQKQFGVLSPVLQFPINEFLGRFLVLKGYLHSNISSTIEAKLENSSGQFLSLKGHPNKEAQRALNMIKDKFLKNRKYFKAYPLPIVTKLGLPGIGNHSGGTFPMRENPDTFETDVLGTPTGFKNVHVVDSTIFPSIPATTISYSIMANAHRIASEL